MKNEEALRERLKGYLERKPRTGPETVHLDVTNACNLDCITCWNYAPDLAVPKPVAWKRQRMDAATFHRMVDESAEAGAERIVISGGGEPFTHPEIYAFIEKVKARGLRLTLITNGTLCDWERVGKLGVDQLLLNMASASPETYVAYHPNQPLETFHRLKEGVRQVRDTTAVNLVQVINRVNYSELPEMVRLAHELGARSSFKVGDVPKGTEHHALTAEQKQQVLEELIPAARKLAKALKVKHNLDAYEAQLSGKWPSGQETGCFAGYLYSRVYVDGRVFFCCEHIEAGHVKDGPFKEVWRAPAYEAVRQRLHRGEYYPGCARCGKHDMNFAAARDLRELLEAGDLP
jgi:MoaA/NifB/PqqE/SkfB family radical SAM enzyme